ncbi:MAG: peptide chain release factor N(5)-glutamine methyltransferase [Bacteroidales bacterium]|nr:peptide chain release factor N(5)-glutamine methyltransferase [Bacteroidales bacterium]
MNIRTIKEIGPYLAGELGGMYPDTETGAFARIIARHLFRPGEEHLTLLPETRLTIRQSDRVRSICRELRAGKPIQLVLGETSFYNCTIRLSGKTLIPRPETEELVDLIIKENKGFSGRLIDIGAGSGCIAIALAVNLPASRVSGMDISEEAIAEAVRNARLNNADVDFFTGDIMAPDLNRCGRNDIVVSNPPYVRESEKKLMAANVLDFEPHEALFVPDSDPLHYYAAILYASRYILLPGGKIYCEINEAMGKEMTELLVRSGFTGIEILRDLNGKERFLKARKNG